MAKRPLKVFQAHLGFYDTVVAAPSRAAALRAWGISQNLFASRQAAETEDAAAVKLASAQPGLVLKRPVGSSAAYEREPKALPEVPSAPAKPPLPGPEEPPRTRPAPDRAALTRAEAAITALDKGRKAEEADLRARQEALDAEKAAAQADYVQRHEKAAAAVVAAREAWRRAGGSDKA